MTVVKAIAHFETTLVNAIDKDSTTMVLNSIATPAGNLPAGFYGFTLEQESNAKREFVTGILSGSTLTFTKRDISPLDASTINSSSDDERKKHRSGSSVKITNFISLAQLSRILSGAEDLDSDTPLSYDDEPTLVDREQIATVGYVLDNVTGGTVVFNKQILTAQVAGETLVQSDIVYLKASDGKWWKADADNSATYRGVQLGVALGAAAADATISGGVQISGLCSVFTGKTANTKYYLSSTAGEITTTEGAAILIGTALSTTEILFSPFVVPDTLLVPTGMITPFGSSTAPSGWLNCAGAAVSRTTYAALFAVIGTTYGAGDGSTTFNLPNYKGAAPIGYGQRVETFTFLDAAVNTGTDVITVASNDFLHTGQAVVLSNSGGALPTGLSATTYYVIRTSATTIKLATSVANANAGTAVDITAAAGGGTHTLTKTYTDRAMGASGGEETHALTDAEQPSHDHPKSYNTGGSGSSTAERYAIAGLTNTDTYSQQSNTPQDFPTAHPQGSDTPHNNMPPYLVANYIIKT